jgi:integrase
LDFRSGRVSIQRRPDDPDDTRGKSALQKTSARVLPMAEHLSLACEELLKDRRSFKAARRHPYLFVNHLGEPLGDRGLRKAYQALRDAVPELGDLINHMLRHDWNDRWVDMMTDHPDWNREECQADQLYAMGWRPGSPMPFLYGKRSREALANKRLLQNQMAERVKAEDQ